MKDYQKLMDDFSKDLDKCTDVKSTLESLDRHAKQFDPTGEKLKRYDALQKIKARSAELEKEGKKLTPQEANKILEEELKK